MSHGFIPAYWSRQYTDLGNILIVAAPLFRARSVKRRNSHVTSTNFKDLFDAREAMNIKKLLESHIDLNTPQTWWTVWLIRRFLINWGNLTDFSLSFRFHFRSVYDSINIWMYALVGIEWISISKWAYSSWMGEAIILLLWAILTLLTLASDLLLFRSPLCHTLQEGESGHGPSSRSYFWC